MNSNQPMNPMNVPYYAHDVVYALKQWSGKMITIQTTHGSLRGIVQEVMQDHVHLHVHGSPFIIRTAQIVWFGPNLSTEHTLNVYSSGTKSYSSTYLPIDRFN